MVWYDENKREGRVCMGMFFIFFIVFCGVLVLALLGSRNKRKGSPRDFHGEQQRIHEEHQRIHQEHVNQTQQNEIHRQNHH
jgi:hypothetical protein